MRKTRKPQEKERQTSPPELDQSYVLSLYVTGSTPRSSRSIHNIRRLCEDRLEGRYKLRVIDIYQQPELARKEQIIASPTLIRSFPLPLRKLVGDLSNEESVLAGLDLATEDKECL
jgi:circadian clock protein KaiB